MGSKHASKPRRNITTGEIARRCGLSRSTVAAALSGKRHIRESTRRKVLECIRRENYHPGMVAKALVGQFSQMVAVLSANVGDYVEMAIFRGINEQLEHEGYRLLLHNVRPDAHDRDALAGTLLAYRAAGYIVLEGAEGANGDHVRHLAAEGIPLVTHTQIPGIHAHAICLDCRAASRDMTDFIIRAGHRRFAHLAGPAFSYRAKERQKGFLESLIEFDLPVSDAIIVCAGDTAATGYHAAREVLADPVHRPTALVCFNDMVAIGAYRAAHELALDIPRDLSVVGLDGVDFAELLGPPLTTMHIVPEALGARSAELIVEGIRGRAGQQPVTEWIQPTLIDRGSVGPPLKPAVDTMGLAAAPASASAESSPHLNWRES